MVTQKSVVLYEVTIQQPDAEKADRIRMDSDVYNTGEVIDFSLVKGNRTIPPDCDISSYRIFLKQSDSLWTEIPGPFRAYIRPSVARPAATNYPHHEPSISEYRFVTTGWQEGHYRIQSDCLNATHEFILRNITMTPSVIRNE